MDLLLMYGLSVGTIIVAAGWMLFEARATGSTTMSLLRNRPDMPSVTRKSNNSYMRMVGIELMGIGVGHIALTITLLPRQMMLSAGITYLGAYLLIALIILLVLWLVNTQTSGQELRRTHSQDRRPSPKR